jgi:hypothetical protein
LRSFARGWYGLALAINDPECPFFPNLAHKRQSKSQIVGFELSFRDCGLTRISHFPGTSHSSSKTPIIKVIINLPIAYQPRAIKTFDANQNRSVKKKHKAGCVLALASRRDPQTRRALFGE